MHVQDKLRLSVYLKDGRKLSGEWAYPCALARLEAAKGFQEFHSFALVKVN